jgi:hypothetical protein
VGPDLTVKKFKKGSKNFRKILGEGRVAPSILKLTSVKTFQRLTNIVVNDEGIFEFCHELWDNKGLNNGLREFCFKFFNNILGINTRVAHYNNARDRLCDLCKRDNVPNPREESFIHIFADCGIAKALKKGFINKWFPEWGDLSVSDWNKFWFFGMEPDRFEKPNLFLLLVAMTGNFYIWDLKIRKKRGSIIGMCNEVEYMIRAALKSSRRIDYSKGRLHYAFCRQLE